MTDEEYKLVENAKSKALEYIKGLDEVYPESELEAFEEIVKPLTESDQTEITVEVSPYWASIDELRGGVDEFDYDNTAFVSIDNIPLLKKDLVVSVIERNYEYIVSSTIELYHYDENENKLISVL